MCGLSLQDSGADSDQRKLGGQRRSDGSTPKTWGNLVVLNSCCFTIVPVTVELLVQQLLCTLAEPWWLV